MHPLRLPLSLVRRILIVLGIPAAICFLLTLPGSLHFGHGEVEALVPGGLWSDWEVTPFIALLTALFAYLYIAGLVRRRGARPIGVWRHVAFFGGLGSIFFGLQSPIDPLADHFFFMHQVEHLMVMHIGALLLAIAMPMGVLLRGLPPRVRIRLIKPIMQNADVAASYDFLSHPVVAPAFFLGAMVVWNLPRIHDLAVLHEDVHYFMHYTMLLTGLFYWWMLLDPRPKAVKRNPLGRRILIVCLITAATNVFAAALTFPDIHLYPVYDQLHGAWGIDAMTDQRLGALILWVPTSMMEVFVFLALVMRWARADAARPIRRTAPPAGYSAGLARGSG